MTCLVQHRHCSLLFFFNDPAPTEIYTLSLHDALPISDPEILDRHLEYVARIRRSHRYGPQRKQRYQVVAALVSLRSEEHTSELQSRPHLVCRLLLEKKKHKHKRTRTNLTTRARPACCR